MNTDYMLVTPSLDGIIRHESIEYEGIKRPPEVNQIFDRPRHRRAETYTVQEKKVIEEYFQDIYGVLMKKLSHFAIDPDPFPEDSVKLLAMVQELINVKYIITGKK